MTRPARRPWFFTWEMFTVVLASCVALIVFMVAVKVIARVVGAAA